MHVLSAVFLSLSVPESFPPRMRPATPSQPLPPPPPTVQTGRRTCWCLSQVVSELRCLELTLLPPVKPSPSLFTLRSPVRPEFVQAAVLYVRRRREVGSGAGVGNGGRQRGEGEGKKDAAAVVPPLK